MNTNSLARITAAQLKHELEGGVIALLTRHGKERLLAPVIEPALGCRLVHVDSIDTDTLGTFTRDVPRPGTQRDAARKKARLGAGAAGCRFALASEGAFISDPWTGMMPWDVEMVMLLDTFTGWEITGIAQGAAMSRQETVRDWATLWRWAEEGGFPDHHLVLRPDHADHPFIIKGIDAEEALQQAFSDALAVAERAQVFVEHDVRAHCNPTRQGLIVEATKNLVERLASVCPACTSPGFWLTERVQGLPCRWCRGPTAVTQAQRWSCVACSHQDTRAVEGERWADPAHCSRCNP